MTDQRTSLCAIVPAYNALTTLPAVLAGVERWRVPIIVVDDGSTDGQAAWLEQWRREQPAQRTVITRPTNGGKAAALRDGFTKAIDLRVVGAITIDADGQHDPVDGERLMAQFIASRSLVCGERDASTPGYPLRNLAGRRLNDLAIRAQTGVAVSDCPCGLRVYPLEAMQRVRCISGRFAWEEEFLTRAIWMGFRYERMPVRCIYAPHGERRSHYRFRRDWPEGIAVNLWLIALALRPPAPSKGSLARFGRQIIGACSLSRARAHLLGDSPARLHGAAAMAIGAATMAIGAVSRTTALALLVGMWIIVRLHASLLLMVLGCIAAGVAAALVDHAAAPAAVALLILLVPSIMALRRRAP